MTITVGAIRSRRNTMTGIVLASVFIDDVPDGASSVVSIAAWKEY